MASGFDTRCGCYYGGWKAGSVDLETVRII